MELKCGSDLLYGTSANPTAGIKYLSTVDPSSGIVAHVGQNGWTPGVFKPFNGGSCINQLTEEYFYSGVGHQLINANTIQLETGIICVNNDQVRIVQFR